MDSCYYLKKQYLENCMEKYWIFEKDKDHFPRSKEREREKRTEEGMKWLVAEKLFPASVDKQNNSFK